MKAYIQITKFVHTETPKIIVDQSTKTALFLHSDFENEKDDKKLENPDLKKTYCGIFLYTQQYGMHVMPCLC